MQNLLQKTLDIKELQQYYPVDEVKDRGCLILMKNEMILKEYDLKKMGKNVVFLSREEIKQKEITAYIEFTKIQLEDNASSVTLIYPTQGIYCRATFDRKECSWILKVSEIIER